MENQTPERPEHREPEHHPESHEHHEFMTACDIAEAVEEDRPQNLFDKIAVFFFSVAIFVGSLALTLIIAAAAAIRYLIGGDLYGYEEIVKLLAFWVYFMGAAYGAYNNTHVTADIVTAYIPEGLCKRLLVFFKDVLTLGICGIFTYFGYDFFMFGFLGPLGTGVAVPKTLVWHIPMWWSYAAIFLGLICMMIYFARNVILSAIALSKVGRAAR